jgi:AcrR family transcriptional regulator
VRGAPATAELLSRAAPGDHIAQFYRGQTRLIQSVGVFAASGLDRGEGVVLALTSRNLGAVKRRLSAGPRSVDALERRGQLVLVDAEPLVSRFMNDGAPDRGQFRDAVGELVQTARRGAGPLNNVRVFGELAAVLRKRGNGPAVAPLEELWSELVKEEAVSVLCGYHVEPGAERGVPRSVAHNHSHVIQDLSSRDRVLQAGRELFTTVGYQEASTAAIARKAGTSESQLVKHFTNKNGLLEAIFADWWVDVQLEIEAVTASELQPVVKLVRLADLLLGAFASDEQLTRLLLCEGDRLRRQEPGSMFAIGVSRFESSLDALIAEVGSGRLGVLGVSVPAIRAALVGACEGLIRDRLSAASGRDAGYELNAIRETLHSLAATLLELDRPALQHSR